MRRRFMSSSKVAFDYLNYMTIEALDDEVKITYTKDIEYGIDGLGWSKYIKGFNIIIKKGQLISFKNNLNPGDLNGYFIIVGKCNLRGNCLSMIFGDNTKNNKDISLYNNSLTGLFTNCIGIQSVDKHFLSATTLASNCYNSMFYGCTSLTNAPELPATTLANSCYRFMFYGCTSLTTAPELPATTLAKGCYYGMFYNCTRLNYIKMLATNISPYLCLHSWVYEVSSTGTFVKNPIMNSLPTATKYNNYEGIPSGWTVVNDGEESSNLITFTINGTEYQAEEGMTFYDWAISEYYDNSCNLFVLAGGNSDLRDDIINGNIGPDDSVMIFYGAGGAITPDIYTDTIIQPISYIVDFGEFA